LTVSDENGGVITGGIQAVPGFDQMPGACLDAEIAALASLEINFDSIHNTPYKKIERPLIYEITTRLSVSAK
jgi:hypothetical protein